MVGVEKNANHKNLGVMEGSWREVQRYLCGSEGRRGLRRDFGRWDQMPILEGDRGLEWLDKTRAWGLSVELRTVSFGK